jgi:hypothetical protein
MTLRFLRALRGDLPETDFIKDQEFTITTLNSAGHKNCLIFIFKLRLVSGKYGRYIILLNKQKLVYGTLNGLTSYNE